ncbi:unnamed protein product [Mucor circinelloides]
MSKTDEASSCYGKVAWTVILKRPQISGILIVDNLTMEVAPKNWVTYGENIQDNFDKSINVVEQENDGKTLESSSSATVPHLPLPLAMMKVFEQRTLNDVCNQVLGELVPENIAKISDSDFIKVTDVINAADSKVINVREGKRSLLKLAANNEQYGWQCH